MINPDITAPMYRAYFYLLDCDLLGKRPHLNDICKNARIASRHAFDLLEKMRSLNLVPEWLELDPNSRSIEAQIRDRLQAKLGGIAEAHCIYGPIDLLTETELIEVKRIEDWKTGFGQVIAKANEYPDHRKHLYLFGNSKRNLRNIKSCCQQLDILVSFEQTSLAAA
ncbi:MAG: hypothetical protein HC805_01150 [Alkalinema sp. RL_2_19]|nr:hypothetical protein [Alkalinema sp. RL_2_19]